MDQPFARETDMPSSKDRSLANDIVCIESVRQTVSTFGSNISREPDELTPCLPQKGAENLVPQFARIYKTNL